MESATAEADDVLLVRFIEHRSRDAHLIVAGMPVFSAAWWKGRDFDAATLEAPLGSGPYKVKTFEQGRFIEFERDPNYWGKDLPVNLGHNNFQRLRFEYYRERQVAFEAFKAGAINYHREYTSRIWATGYDFAAVNDGRIVKETLHNGAPTPVQGWYLNTRREQFKDPRVREAIGYAFDFEWTNKNVMYSSYKRVSSYFQNSPMAAEGLPGPEELKLLEPWRGKIPDSVFGEPYVPPVSDGSGSDRALLKKANELLLSAGCTRDGGVLKLPNGQPLTIEFLEASRDLSAACDAVPAESAQARHRGALAHRRSHAVQEPHRQFRFRRDFARARRLDDAGLGAEAIVFLGVGEHGRVAQSLRDFRPSRGCAGRDHRQREVARRTQHRLPRARPHFARGTLLGRGLV